MTPQEIADKYISGEQSVLKEMKKIDLAIDIEQCVKDRTTKLEAELLQSTLCLADLAESLGKHIRTFS